MQHQGQKQLQGRKQSATVSQETRYWLQFEQLLATKAAEKDIAALRVVNRKLSVALKKYGPAKTAAEREARQRLAKRHAQILQQLAVDKAQLEQVMQTFLKNQDGLSSYMLTALAGGDSLENMQNTGILAADDH